MSTVIDIAIPRTPSPLIGFVQGWGVDTPSGGARILRSLLRDAPVDALSINSGCVPAPLARSVREIQLPYRPWLGRIERTRLGVCCQWSNRWFLERFTRRLAETCGRERITALHSVAHGWDCFAVSAVAAALNIPFFLSVHDHLDHTLRLQGAASARQRFGALWRKAAARFAISDELAQEYCNRYGARPYTLITDGLEAVARAPRPPVKDRVRVYFMGLFHVGYIDNLRHLLAALGVTASRNPGWQVSLTCRCGGLPAVPVPAGVNLRVLPFTDSDAEIAADLEDADLLYLPLDFRRPMFSRYSLSTKMVTYLGSGIPILYHGPEDAAASRLLSSHPAALCCFEPGGEPLEQVLLAPAEKRYAVALAALALARSQFQLAEIRARFWNSIAGATTSLASHSVQRGPE